MTVTKENHQSFYQQGAASGFHVVDARQYYVKETEITTDLEQMIATPWTVSGSPVFGYAVTRIGLAEERQFGYRKTHTLEFWTFDTRKGPVNLGNLYPDGYQLSDADGNTVDLNTALATLRDFASAASYKPHVFLAPEFAEARNYINSRMGLPPVTSADYRNYLNHIEGQIRNSGNTFVGKITKISDMKIAYDSMEGME